MHDPRAFLLPQLDTAWKLASYHLDGLTTEECLWRPAAKGPHVHRESGGRWRADWPETEGYDIGAPSIAWITWHMVFWWSMVIDHSFCGGKLARESVDWPGDADGVRLKLGELHERWRTSLEALDTSELLAADRTRWPYRDRPFAHVVAWVNLELTKNAAELGYARFLVASSRRLT